jgi:hypothetical protein
MACFARGKWGNFAGEFVFVCSLPSSAGEFISLLSPPRIRNRSRFGRSRRRVPRFLRGALLFAAGFMAPPGGLKRWGRGRGGS